MHPTLHAERLRLSSPTYDFDDDYDLELYYFFPSIDSSTLIHPLTVTTGRRVYDGEICVCFSHRHLMRRRTTYAYPQCAP